MKKTNSQMLLGENVTLIQSKNKSDIGITGMVVNETKSMITINHNQKHKMFFKKNIIIKIGDKEVNCSEIYGRMFERIRK